MTSLELKKTAERILKEYSIMELSEKGLIEKLIKIEDGETNTEYAEKTLKYLEDYLKIKEKMRVAEKDMKYFENLAESLRKQEINGMNTRKTTLFKLKIYDMEYMYFISRDAMYDYIKRNNITVKGIDDIIEIPSNKSIELENLLEAIMRNF